MDDLELYANADICKSCVTAFVSLRYCCRKSPFFMDVNQFASESRSPEHKITDGTSKVAVPQKKIFLYLLLSDLLLLQIQSILPRSSVQRKKKSYWLVFCFNKILPTLVYVEIPIVNLDSGFRIFNFILSGIRIDIKKWLLFLIQN